MYNRKRVANFSRGGGYSSFPPMTTASASAAQPQRYRPPEAGGFRHSIHTSPSLTPKLASWEHKLQRECEIHE